MKRRARRSAVGEFSQSHDIVSGTILTTTGDHRYLAGQVQGDELYLSTFDGAHVFLYKAKIAADGSLDGDWWSGLTYHEKWIGKRDAAAALPDAYGLTAMRAGTSSVSISPFRIFPATPSRPRIRNFAARCSSSRWPAAGARIATTKRRFSRRFTRTIATRAWRSSRCSSSTSATFQRAAAATQRFRQHYGIEYTTLIAGISDKDEAAKKLPMLKRVRAFPTTVFIDRKGNVRKIHTGYTGPATGDHYIQFVNEVKATLDQLLAET